MKLDLIAYDEVFYEALLDMDGARRVSFGCAVAARYLPLYKAYRRGTDWMAIEPILAAGAKSGSYSRVALGMAVFGLTMAVPFVLLSLLLEETTGLSDLVLIAGVAFIVARLLHAFGMLRRIHRARQLGATLSVMIEIVLGVLLLRVGAGLVGL